MKPTTICFVAILAVLRVWADDAPTRGAYHLLKEIPVGGDNWWDYMSVDSGAHRLYVAHGTKVEVIDIEKNVPAGAITDVPGAHGFALAPELGLGFSSNGRENKAGIVDLKTLKTVMKVDTGGKPDAIMYEPTQQEVYSFNGDGKSVTVFAAKTGKVVATIPLAGQPEFGVTDGAGKVFCNLEDTAEVVAIDAKTHAVTATWPLKPAGTPTGLAIDIAHHRLFSGCRSGALVMLDSVTGQVVASVRIGGNVDAVWFDPGTQMAFASCGGGTVTIAHEDSPEKLTVVQTLKTAPGSRTMALDPQTHRIYLAAIKMAPAEAGQKPKIVPGSFQIFVYTPEP